MKDYKPLGKHHCYACIQWDGSRSLENKDKGIMVDVSSEGTCRIKHTKVKGSFLCTEFFPLK